MMNAETTRDTLVKRGRLAAIAALACCAAATATMAETAKAARPVPRPALAERLKAGPEIIGIVHWGLNTFTDKEWGFGDADPKLLAPAKFDADQIASAAKAGGLGGLVIVCKHHDGFCLWPTKTTEYNITKTPFWRGTGNGERIPRAKRVAEGDALAGVGTGNGEWGMGNGEGMRSHLERTSITTPVPSVPPAPLVPPA